MEDSVEIGVGKCVENVTLFHLAALTLSVGRQEGHPAGGKLSVGLLMVKIGLEPCTSCTP